MEPLPNPHSPSLTLPKGREWSPSLTLPKGREQSPSLTLPKGRGLQYPFNTLEGNHSPLPLERGMGVRLQRGKGGEATNTAVTLRGHGFFIVHT